MSKFMRGLSLLGMVLFSSCQPSSHQDLLFRKEIDPFSFYDSSPKKPIDEKAEALRFNEKQWDPLFLKQIYETPNYLNDWQKHIYLPDPPANTSPRTRAELNYILQLQEKRTSQHQSAIQNEIAYGVFSAAPWLGKGFHAQNMPQTDILLRRAVWDTTIIIHTLKKQFNRARPSVLDPRIQPCIDIPGYPAYPSGHSTQFHLIALIHQELYPQDGEAFQREAFRIAWDREVAGLHYTSDTASGKLLAQQIFNLLKTKQNFLLDLSKARSEWLSKPWEKSPN